MLTVKSTYPCPLLQCLIACIVANLGSVSSARGWHSCSCRSTSKRDPRGLELESLPSLIFYCTSAWSGRTVHLPCGGSPGGYVGTTDPAAEKRGVASATVLNRNSSERNLSSLHSSTNGHQSRMRRSTSESALTNMPRAALAHPPLTRTRNDAEHCVDHGNSGAREQGFSELITALERVEADAESKMDRDKAVCMQAWTAKLKREQLAIFYLQVCNSFAMLLCKTIGAHQKLNTCTV